jgi:2,5-diketo-D-gluconate reductase B
MKTVNGIPILGTGTYPLIGEEAVNTVRMALELGLRHVDTAQMYGNEKAVGTAIASSGIPREELFVVTKVDPGNTSEARFHNSVSQSIADLGGPADLFLIHWPPDESGFDLALDLLMAEKRNGNAKEIGVSNFPIGMMRRAHERTGGAIICNQVEFHPLLDQSQVLQVARELGIALAAYSPLARGEALKPQVIQAIAERTGRRPSEIVLRWIVQQGVIAIPMTTKRANLESNLTAVDFALTDTDMSAISAIGSPEGRTINPSRMAGRWND